MNRFLPPQFKQKPPVAKSAQILPFRPRPQNDLAFTLTELLIVVALLSVLSALMVPALSSLNASGSLRQNLSTVVGLVESARQTAVTRNTYVYVAFLSPEAARNLPPSQIEPGTTYAAVFVSMDGTDVLKQASSSMLREVDGNITRLERIAKLRSLRFSGEIPSSNALANRLEPVDAEGPGSAWKIESKPPPEGMAITFDRIIKFLPQGGARVTEPPVEAIQLIVSPNAGSESSHASEDLKAAVIRIDGLTGKISVHQPG